MVIEDCFSLCKTYGKTSDDMRKMQKGFVTMLGDYPPEKIIKAFRTHVQRSEELPTLAAIINLIERNGRPPLKESDVIAIRKKHGEDRTSEDWEDLREWEAQQRNGWDDMPAPIRVENVQRENETLRQRVKQLEAQLQKGEYNAVLDDREARAIEIKQAVYTRTKQQKLDATIEWMRSTGASENDIQEFINSQR